MNASSLRQNFNTHSVLRLTGLTRRQLDYWDTTGLVRPSVRRASGSGSRRVYSFDDLVSLRVLADMRQADVSVQALRRVVAHLKRSHHKPLSAFNVFVQGRRVFVRTGDPRTLEDITAGGQFTMVLPFEGIARRLSEKVSEISAPRTLAVRVAGREYKAVATPDLEAGGYSIAVPELPGCYSEARRLGEARRDVREAIEAYLGAGIPVQSHSKRAAR